MKKKSTIYFNLFTCLLFMGLSCYMFTVKSNIKIFFDLPFNQAIGGMGVIVNTILLLKWVIIFKTQQKS